jgi:hypothetical protein
MQQGKRFVATEESTDINAYTVSKFKVKQSQKENILMKQKFCRCWPMTLKSRYCSKVHCSVVQNNIKITVVFITEVL